VSDNKDWKDLLPKVPKQPSLPYPPYNPLSNDRTLERIVQLLEDIRGELQALRQKP
jgi:hypothetical protein